MIRVGVLGYGYWGPTIARNFHGARCCELVAICDKSQTAQERARRAFPGVLVTGDRDAYAYLVESIRRFPRQSELAEIIAGVGLNQVKFRNLTGGVAALYSAWRL